MLFCLIGDVIFTFALSVDGNNNSLEVMKLSTHIRANK